MKLSQKRIKQTQYCLIALSIAVLLSVSAPLKGQSPQPLPSPSEAIRQAEQIPLTELPGKLADLEIDELTRDRLRFDPAWQPIAQAIRNDIMVLKWGNGQLENPVWKQYGAKAYPLLDYYARSADPTRQAYGMLGIRSLGKPYTTLWLERQLQRRSSNPSFFNLTASPAVLLNPNADVSGESNWRQEFGLDDAAVRDRLTKIARQNLEPQNSPTYYDQFNLSFLTEVLGYEAVFPYQPTPEASQPSIPEWDEFSQIPEPTEAQVQAAVHYYNQLPRETQDYILVKRLGTVKAGQLSTFGRLFFHAIARNPAAPDRTWAWAELNRHSDPLAQEMMETILNGDFKPLYSLTHLVSYGDFASEVDKSAHAYYLLLGMAQKYSNSQFIRAAREYGNLTGRSYFGGELRSPIILERLAQKTPAEKLASWQDWLNRYPNHPGADDATYFVARSLQDQNQIMSALDRWVELMTQSIGDGDAKYLAWAHLRTLLDVGLTTDQLQQVLNQYQTQPIAPLFRYALAVHQARDQDYATALQTSAELDLTQMPETVLGSYYNPQIFSSYNQGWQMNPMYSPQAIQQRMQSMLTEQRQGWQKLRQLQATDTPASRYELASAWAGSGGWKYGYLAVWDDRRTSVLPTGTWSDEYCQIFWVCNTQLRGRDGVQANYQEGSQNAVALSLYESLLNQKDLPAAIQEKALFMKAATLLSQWEDYPIGETFRIHPPIGVQSAIQAADSSPDDSEAAYQAWEQQYNQIEQDYLTALDQSIAQLEAIAPQSQYIDDLLFSRFIISGQAQYLEKIVTQYPQGDRVAEAHFLLAHRR
ncbi:MAG TPA: hypothetical protein V6D10_21750 [Trichocoleus sp.]